jgi:hypothetical protein
MAHVVSFGLIICIQQRKDNYMKRSEIDAAIERAIGNAKKFGVALPKWADWHPLQFDASADGIRHQKLGWKPVFWSGRFSQLRAGRVCSLLTACR